MSTLCEKCPMPSHNGRHAESNLDRLMRHVDTSGGPDACWPWTAGLDRKYGDTYLWRDGRMVKMHGSRAVYIATHGDLPADMFVLHSCDNPPCCNPAHLRPGTHLENMADRKERGNYATGADIPWALQVTPELIAQIRDSYAPGVRGRGTPSLAKRFGISRSSVQRIVTGSDRWGDGGWEA